jgi:hypothetical protein
MIANKFLLHICKSNIVVGLGVWSFVEITLFFNDIKFDNYSILALFSTISVYNYSLLAIKNKIFNFAFDYSFRNIAFWISSLISLYYFLSMPSIVQLQLLPAALISFAYPLVVVKSKKISLRELPYIKILLISILWSYITYFVPVFSVSGIEQVDLVIFIARFLMVFALVLPFDIRDVKTDPVSMKTIPQLIGVFNSKILGILIFLSGIGMELTQMNHPNWLIGIIMSAIFSLLMFKSDKVKKLYFFSIYIESIPFLTYLLIQFSVN